MANALYMIRASSFSPPAVPVFLGNRDDFDRKLSGAISVLASGIYPVGTVWQTAAEKSPAGWLICDGTAQSRLAFPALFGVIGERYGAGDGVSTFNIPTQAQCAPPAIAPTPPQVVEGGAIVPEVPVVVPEPETNPTGGSGLGEFVGGRVDRFDIRFDAP